MKYVFYPILLIFLFSEAAWTEYNDNMSGIISDVLTYTEGDYIYFRLDNQPTIHPECNPSYFVIEGAVPYERRQILLSRLLTAYVSKENINIGFDKNGNCAKNHIRVHRIG